MSGNFYELFPQALLEAIALERDLEPSVNLAVKLSEQDQHDFWSTQVFTGMELNLTHIKAMLYIQGFCHKAVPENHYNWLTLENDLQSWINYREFWRRYGNFTLFPPVLETPVSIASQLVPMARQMLLVKLVPAFEIDRLTDPQVLRIIETGFLPADIALRTSRYLYLVDLFRNLDQQYQGEVTNALIALYGSLENFYGITVPNRWEQVILQIDQLNSSQLACVTRVIFPEKLEDDLKLFPAVWRHRIYILRSISMLNDPEGKLLDFSRFKGIRRRKLSSWGRS